MAQIRSSHVAEQGQTTWNPLFLCLDNHDKPGNLLKKDTDWVPRRTQPSLWSLALFKSNAVLEGQARQAALDQLKLRTSIAWKPYSSSGLRKADLILLKIV